VKVGTAAAAGVGGESSPQAVKTSAHNSRARQ
jgi:hypothetical protein